ncbi:unnamed protein product [Soboliphyme baturini]|uniref:Uncharacterized protein n=1 Tax=Soboliphyme baturini TaxID=241478 RepID=A0A183IIG0_9BILA|nr:unnamed protein product [Soboliphyme baturini]
MVSCFCEVRKSLRHWAKGWLLNTRRPHDGGGKFGPRPKHHPDGRRVEDTRKCARFCAADDTTDGWRRVHLRASRKFNTTTVVDEDLETRAPADEAEENASKKRAALPTAMSIVVGAGRRGHMMFAKPFGSLNARHGFFKPAPSRSRTTFPFSGQCKKAQTTAVWAGKLLSIRCHKPNSRAAVFCHRIGASGRVPHLAPSQDPSCHLTRLPSKP